MSYKPIHKKFSMRVYHQLDRFIVMFYVKIQNFIFHVSTLNLVIGIINKTYFVLAVDDVKLLK